MKQVFIAGVLSRAINLSVSSITPQAYSESMVMHITAGPVPSTAGSCHARAVIAVYQGTA